jgi:hypothetical protein
MSIVSLNKEMKKYIYLFLLVLSLLTVVFISCHQSTQPLNKIPGEIPIYTFPPKDNQPANQPQSTPPVVSSPPSNEAKEEYVERNIVVTEQNSIFSIGIPAGSKEKTDVIAQKPINFWFEYLAAEAKLEINGTEVQRNPFSWETKIHYTKSVTKFSYEITNTTGNYISYNLHLVPSMTGESIPVVVRQHWIP